MIKPLKLITFVAVVSVFAVLTGCATPAQYQSMIVKPTSVEQNPKLKGAIVVTNVSGGRKTEPLSLGISYVDNDGLRKALEGSLDAYGYLAGSFSKAQYKLDADLLDLKQTGLLAVTAKSVISYKISSTDIVKKYQIEVSGIATVSDEFCGYKRLRMANERSIQANIKEFFKRLNSL
ncbi:conserved exported hypothetical protein [Gammaproteobacteria bacterium]